MHLVTSERSTDIQDQTQITLSAARTVYFSFLLLPITLLLAAAAANSHQEQAERQQFLGLYFSNCEVCGRFLFFFRRRQHRKVDGALCEDRCTVLRPSGFDDCGKCLCQASNAAVCPDRISAQDATPCGNFGPDNPEKPCYCGTKADGSVACGDVAVSAIPECPFLPCDADDDCTDICIDLGGPEGCFANYTDISGCDDIIKENRVCGYLCTNTTWQDEEL